MFDILFGWRKASKCKKLVKLLHCRLNLLKRKRHSIVRQLREDTAQLLKIGQNEAAFVRVEQLFKDQSLLDAYDLLDHYCEFIILHFRYIRRHKDRPKDINEAVSTLIFAAAWFGDLPELRAIRKLFGNRYGQKFIKEVAALQSGNLVNYEIREKLCIKFISDGVKLKLINEIAKDYGLQLWYLGCDDGPKHHLLQLSGKDHQLEGFVFQGEDFISYSSTREAMMLASYAKRSPDVASKLISHPLDKAPLHRRTVQIENHRQDKYMYEPSDLSNLESCGSNKLSAASFEDNAGVARTESPYISFQYHKRTVYVEEVEELEFKALQDQYSEDKRLFLFNSSPCLLTDNYGVGGSTLLALSHHQSFSDCNDSNLEHQDGITLSGNTHVRVRKSSAHMSERRLDTEKNHKYKSPLSPTNMKDKDCVIFNGESYNVSPCQKHFYHQISHSQDEQRTMMSAKECRSASLVCYEKVWHEPVEGDVRSCKCTCSQMKPYCSSTLRPGKKFRYCLEEQSCYIGHIQENGTQTQDRKKLVEVEGSDCAERYASPYSSWSKKPSPYSPKRLKGTSPDGDNQSVQLSEVSTTSSCSHVHPKLPDYDELAAKFRALKEEHRLEPMH